MADWPRVYSEFNDRTRAEGPQTDNDLEEEQNDKDHATGAERHRRIRTRGARDVCPCRRASTDESHHRGVWLSVVGCLYAAGDQGAEARYGAWARYRVCRASARCLHDAVQLG